MKRIALWSAFAIAAVLLAAGCGKSASTSTPAQQSPGAVSLRTSTPAAQGTYPGKVTWALYRDVDSLDPIIAFDYPENTVIASMCDTLLRQSPQGVVGSGLASL